MRALYPYRCTVCLAILFAAGGAAAAADLESVVYIQAGGMTLDVGYGACPTAADWNSDGRKDLLVGQNTSGKLRFYPNQGTDSEPSFGGYSYVKCGGVDITTPPCG
ncbi:MAG: hypothetical protein JXR37_08880 [Kiritimatiellae bacterium]|nr:hypothetical protein [Kiritimatiellia bacterium]